MVTHLGNFGKNWTTFLFEHLVALTMITMELTMLSNFALFAFTFLSYGLKHLMVSRWRPENSRSSRLAKVKTPSLFSPREISKMRSSLPSGNTI